MPPKSAFGGTWTPALFCWNRFVATNVGNLRYTIYAVPDRWANQLDTLDVLQMDVQRHYIKIKIHTD